MCTRRIEIGLRLGAIGRLGDAGSGRRGRGRRQRRRGGSAPWRRRPADPTRRDSSSWRSMTSRRHSTNRRPVWALWSRGSGPCVVVVVVGAATWVVPSAALAPARVRVARRHSAQRVGAATWCGVLPDVATNKAISASDTARITHQLGRPRTTRERTLSVVPDPSPTTGTPYARATPLALGRSGAEAPATAVPAGVERRGDHVR